MRYNSSVGLCNVPWSVDIVPFWSYICQTHIANEKAACPAAFFVLSRDTGQFRTDCHPALCSACRVPRSGQRPTTEIQLRTGALPHPDRVVDLAPCSDGCGHRQW